MSEQLPEGANAQVMFTQWLESLRVMVMESAGGVVLRGARAVQVGTGGTRRPTTTPAALAGFALRETSGAAPAVVVLRDGSDATGDPTIPITLAPGESVREWFGPGGVNLVYGLYVDVVSGAVDGSVFLRGAQ